MFIGNKEDPESYFKDIGLVSSIITFNCFDEVNAMHNEGILFTYDTIADWSVEFAKRTNKTDWESIIVNGNKLLFIIDENEIWELEGEDYKEVVINYVYEKIEQYASKKP